MKLEIGANGLKAGGATVFATLGSWQPAMSLCQLSATARRLSWQPNTGKRNGIAGLTQLVNRRLHRLGLFLEASSASRCHQAARYCRIAY